MKLSPKQKESRPIKFRAWDKQENQFYTPTHEAYKGNLFELMISFSGDLLAHYMKYNVDGVKHESVFPDRFVLMQFTGLTDKNGKPIYEGDIIKYQRHGSMGWVIQDPEIIEDIRHCSHLMDDTIKDIEVIGNIYENSSLLK